MLKKLPLAWNLFQANRKSMGTIKSMGLVVRTANKFIYREYGIGIRTPVYLKKEGDYDDLNNPVGLYNLWCLDVRLHPLAVKVDAQEPKRINILIPALRPKLIFGGYIALLNFIIHLSAQGYRVRLIICEEISQTAMQVRAECREHKLAQSVLENAELLVIHNKSEVIAVILWIVLSDIRGRLRGSLTRRLFRSIICPLFILSRNMRGYFIPMIVFVLFAMKPTLSGIMPFLIRIC